MSRSVLATRFASLVGESPMQYLTRWRLALAARTLRSGNDQASQILIRGVGTSNFFLHGDVQVGLSVPKDPTKAVSGAASAFDRNVNSNTGFGFDLIDNFR